MNNTIRGFQQFLSQNKEAIPQTVPVSFQKALEEALKDGRLTQSEIFNLIWLALSTAFANLSLSEALDVIGLIMKGDYPGALMELLEGLVDKD